MPVIIFSKKGAWPFYVTPKFFRVSPNISGMGKAMNIKFVGLLREIDKAKAPDYLFPKRGVA